jgi:hypothetical protein
VRIITSPSFGIAGSQYSAGAIADPEQGALEMPTDKTITAREAGVSLPGMRVSAKYKGTGTVVVPSHEMMDKPHFDDDVCVRWDAGQTDWHGVSVLQYC